MTNISDDLKQKIAEHEFRDATWTKPTVRAVALCTAEPLDTHTGATIPEVDVSDVPAYERESLAPGNSNWAYNGTTHQISNSSAIVFGPLSAPGGDVVVTHWAMCDDVDVGQGNVARKGQFVDSNGDPAPITIGLNPTTITIAAGSLKIDYDGAF